ncbi:MAG: ABC transporter substrate-binding protein [Bacteroidia bacterium]|nr:ABC transporter substrate-binding protein [Bacteroidia bacterium]
MKTITTILTFSLLSVLVLLTGCKKDKNTPFDPIQPFTLGVILPMDQVKGPLREKALRTAIDEINEAGGVGSGFRIDLMVKSSEGANREEAAAEVAREIIASAPNLVGFITSFSSTTKGVVEQIAIPESYPVISGSATAGNLSGVSPYFSRLCPPDAFEATVLTQQAISYGISTVAIAVEEGDIYSENLATAFQEAFGGGASTIVSFQQNDPDYVTKLNQLISGDPEAIFISMLNPDVYIEFITKVSELNKSKTVENTSFILCDGLYSTAILEAPVEIMVGEVNGHPKNFGAMPSADTTTGAYIYFQAELMKRFQQEVSSYNAQFYDIGYLYSMAIEKTLLEIGTDNMKAFREKVNYWIREVSHGSQGDPPVMPTLGWKSIKYACMNDGVDYQGASGNCNIDQQGNTITPYAIFRIKGSPGAYYLEIISIVYP